MAYSSYTGYPTKTFPEGTLELDLDLLLTLCRVQGKSGQEHRMRATILLLLEGMGLTGREDTNGNITCTKGEADFYPTFVAHMDTVHDAYMGFDVAVSDDQNVLYAFAQGVIKENLSRIGGGMVQCGVGGDDRCGLYVALHLLRELPAAKICFTVEEECGMAKGAGFVDMSFFDDSAYVLQCDRKGHDDWVQTASSVKLADDNFIDSIRDLLKDRDYKPMQYGGPTDVMRLKSRGLGVCAANMSCGYYSPHSSSETIFLPALQNTLNLCLEVVNRLGYEQQVHTHSVATPTTYRSAASNTAYVKPVGPAAINSNNFFPRDYGWQYLPKNENNQFLYEKTVDLDGVLTCMRYTYLQVRDYELAQLAAKGTSLQEIVLSAKQIKEQKKKLKDWIKKDGSWEFDASKKQWQKVLPDELNKNCEPCDEQYWIVGYAKLMTDIPAVEKEWQKEWGECLDVDLAADEVCFTAREISRYIHEDLKHKAIATQAADDAHKQMALFTANAHDDELYDTTSSVDIFCPDCHGELQLEGSNGEHYCVECMDWKKPLQTVSPMNTMFGTQRFLTQGSDDDYRNYVEQNWQD